MSQQLDYSLTTDQLLSELSVPKQDFTPKPPTGPLPGQDKPGLFPSPVPEPDFRTPEQIESDRAAAERSGYRMAKTIDGIASFSAAILAKEKETHKYKASPGDIEDLAQAWGEVSEKYQFNFSPWLNVLLLSMSTYVPIFMKASNDRRFNILNQKHEELQKRIEDLEKETEAKEKNR